MHIGWNCRILPVSEHLRSSIYNFEFYGRLQLHRLGWWGSASFIWKSIWWSCLAVNLSVSSSVQLYLGRTYYSSWLQHRFSSTKRLHRINAQSQYFIQLRTSRLVKIWTRDNYQGVKDRVKSIRILEKLKLAVNYWGEHELDRGWDWLVPIWIATIDRLLEYQSGRVAQRRPSSFRSEC